MRKFTLALILLAGCSATRLEPLLSAADEKAFDEKLRTHGPVDSYEVPTLQSEAQGKDPLRADFAEKWLQKHP